MPGKVGLASVGLGWWGKVLAEAVAKTGEAEIVSCFARGDDGRREFAQQFGCRQAGSYDELLSDPEVEGVVIATSHQSHRSLIEEAASAGKAVFVEKPFTLTVDDARAAVQAVDKAGTILQVGHQRRRSAANRAIKTMIEAGELGDLQATEAIQSVPNGFTMPDQAWRWNADQSPLGGMTSLGIHKIDTMLYLVGPIRSVFCFTRPGRDVSIDEMTALTVEHESGALGTLVTSFFVPRISQISVYGTDRAAFNIADGTCLQIQERMEVGRTEVDLTPVDPIVDQLVEFARAIRGDTTVEVDGRAGLAVVAVMQAAVESASSGRAVEISEVM